MENQNAKVVSIGDIHRDGDNLVVSVGKSGAGALSIERQKTWLAKWKQTHTGEKDTTNEGKRQYQAYRVTMAREFNSRITEKMQKGELLVHRASISKTGAVRGVSFLTPRDASAARANEAQTTIAKEFGIAEDVLARILEAGKRKAKADEPIAVVATQVVEPVAVAASA